MVILPQDYIEELQAIFGTDTAAYQDLMAQPPYKGLSVNRLKARPETLLAELPFATEKSPFYADGYYICGESDGVGRHPYHQAGAFYVQEPSATSAVTLLDIQPNDKVLDLCAAPGGKSAQIASCLCGTGLLWSNEVVRHRAQILLSNFERMGVREGVVSSCHPETLCEALGGFFDKVLVDAPCSGEGMFRKDPEAIGEWSREHVKACAERQFSILHSAAQAVKVGGTLVYSTCTFSHEENEGVIQAFLSAHPDFEAVDVHEPFGRPSGLACGVRITPMDGGEGHFAAKLRRIDGDADTSPSLFTLPSRPDKQRTEVLHALSDILADVPQDRLYLSHDKAFFLPRYYPNVTGVGVVRAGVLAGEWKKNRLEPSHALFMATPPDVCRQVLRLSLTDSRVKDFLQGLEIDTDGSTPDGYTSVTVNGYSLGFGKTSHARLKNKYPKGLRTSGGA